MTTDIEAGALDIRDLPNTIDYYYITESGDVVEGAVGTASVYIDEMDVNRFSDRELMLHIRKNYGECIGVMRDLRCTLKPRKSATTKFLLGTVESLA